LFPAKDPSKTTYSDSELIALMLGKLLKEGQNIKTAIQTLIETKLIGTWRLAIVLTAEPDKLYVTKNAGPLFMGKSEGKIVICSDQSILNEQASNFTFSKLRVNTLYEISDDCSIT